MLTLEDKLFLIDLMGTFIAYFAAMLMALYILKQGYEAMQSLLIKFSDGARDAIKKAFTKKKFTKIENN